MTKQEERWEIARKTVGDGRLSVVMPAHWLEYAVKYFGDETIGAVGGPGEDTLLCNDVVECGRRIVYDPWGVVFHPGLYVSLGPRAFGTPDAGRAQIPESVSAKNPSFMIK